MKLKLISFDRVSAVLLAVALVLNAGAWAVILWKLPYTSDPVFLHYNIYFGIDLTGSWYELLWIPGSGLAALVINSVIIVLNKRMDAVVRISSMAVTASFQAILLLASVLVVLLNK
ncbi:MAG: hypothetical protein ABIG66_04175 [Candidatus Kerfeldbacteria bacterium]